MANVLGLRIVESEPVEIKGGITGIGTFVKLGIADRISLGSIEIHNAVFLVFPDSALTFDLPGGRFKLDPILGFPVIKELGVVTVSANQITIAKEQDGNPQQHNMAIDLFKPVLFLSFNGDDLPFTFDSGADKTLLSEVFYNRYRQYVDNSATADEEQYGGAGGIKVFHVAVLTDLTLQTSGQTILLKNVSVSKDEVSTTDGVYYGNIGQDFISQFRTMTLDFNRCHISFER